jgi:hypothetical protein
MERLTGYVFIVLALLDRFMGARPFLPVLLFFSIRSFHAICIAPVSTSSLAKASRT